MMKLQLLFVVCTFFFVTCTPSTTKKKSPCPAGQELCGEQCVDLLVDSAHCGSCDAPCQEFASCDGTGNCLLDCPHFMAECDDRCFNLATSVEHCGGCHMPCPEGNTCVGGECDDGTCYESVSEAEEGTLPADIIIVVDNSGSMADEAASVQASMHDFVATLQASDIDAHVILISADSTSDTGICVPAPVGSGQCPADENLPTYRHVVRSVGSTNALSIILSSYSEWESSLRPNATRNFLVISDDNAGMSATDFMTQMVALDPTFEGFKFSAIFAPYKVSNSTCVTCEILGTCHTTSCDVCCGKDSLLNVLCVPLTAAEGRVYRDLVQATGGIAGNLCIQDFLPAFIDLATAVIWGAAVDCVYNIPEPPAGVVIDYGQINVDYQPSPGDQAIPVYHVPGGLEDCGSAGGWYYDDHNPPEQILLCPATCAEVSENFAAVITVKFGCATLVQ